MNVRIPVIVTHSTHRALRASRAPLTVLAQPGMVEMSDLCERMMVDVMHDTLNETSAAFQCGDAR